jgi:hypothetical protein
VKHWEVIADNLSKAGSSWGRVSAMDSNLQTIWIVGAHRDDAKRFVVNAEEKLTAFMELESAIRCDSFTFTALVAVSPFPHLVRCRRRHLPQSGWSKAAVHPVRRTY